MRPRGACIVVVAATLGVGLEPPLHGQGNNGRPDQKVPPPVVVIGGAGGGAGAGGSAGGGGSSAPGSGGGGGGGLYDGYGDIDWDGPDVLPRSPLIFAPFPVEPLIDRFRAATAHLPGSVRREDLTYDQAMLNLRALIPGPGLEMIQTLTAEASAVAGASNIDNYGAAAGMVGRLDTLLVLTLSQHLANPQDPTLLFNVASLLTQRGLVNEAVAMLDRLRASRRNPEMAFGYSPTGSLDYLQGYTAMLRGELGVARTLLARSFSADRSIADASYALAVVEQALGGDVRKPLLEGFLLAYGGQPLMYCGDKYASDPLTTEEEQNVGPPTDRVFDLSIGVDGVLPQLAHPASGEELAARMADLEGTRRKIEAEVLGHTDRATALHETLSNRLAGPNPKPTDFIDQALADLINDANACLKPLHRMREQRDAIAEEMAEAIQRDADLVVPLLIKAAEITDPARNRQAARAIVAQSVTARRGAIQRWDTAVRINHRSWFKYATALALHMTDLDWQDYAKETILAATKTEWLALNVGVVANYGAYLPASTDLYVSPAAVPAPAAVAPPPMALCTPATAKGSLEVDLVKVPIRTAAVARPEIGVSMEVSCDKIALEMDGMVGVGLDNVAQIGVGGFAEASRDRGGDVTIFGGAKQTGTVGQTRGSAREGIYLTFDSEGLKEIGAKVDSAQRAGGGPAGMKLQTYDKGFVIWTGAERPPRFDKDTGLRLWPTVR